MAITLAIPSKGRLKQAALEKLAGAGLEIVQPGDNRRYRAHVRGRDDIDIALISADEIAREIGQGKVDLGITGEDLLRESLGGAEERYEIGARLGFGRNQRDVDVVASPDMGAVTPVVARLGFGHADVVVAVPDCWLDVDTMRDLDDVAAEFRQRHGRRLRIATKYWRLTQQFFSAQHGIQVYRIVESLGATEGAPAAGSADVIVDITTTGSTLAANHLKVLSDGVILRSQACLAVSRKDRDGVDRALVTDIAARLDGKR